MTKSQPNITEIQQLHRSGFLAEAKSGYQQILETNPNDVTALHWLGLLYAEMGDAESAQNCLQRAIALEPDDPTLKLHFANILKASDKFAEATEVLLNIIHAFPNFAAAFNNLGTVYYRCAKFKEAIDAYQAAIKIQPNYVDAYYNLGLAYSKSQRMQEAINVYQSLLELSPGHVGAEFQLGCFYMQRGDYQAARKHFMEIEKHHPFHFETQTNLATCYLKLGDLDNALQHYAKAQELMPQDVQVLFNLGVIHMQQGRLQAAITFYTRAVQVNPDLYDAHNNLGFIYLTQKRNDLALRHFRETLRLQPHNQAIRHTINILSNEKNISTSPAEYISSLFDSYADHYDAHLQQTLHYQVPQMMLDEVSEIADLSSKKWDILDLGCGTGLSGILFQPFAKTMIGVDLSEKMLAVAAQKNIYDELILADVLSFLSDKKEKYDLMLAADVLMYLGDLTDFIPAVAKALKSNGLFIFNAEISDDENYRLTSSGRFEHSKKYLDQLILENHLHILRYREAKMRMQENEPVYGHLYVIGK